MTTSVLSRGDGARSGAVVAAALLALDALSDATLLSLLSLGQEAPRAGQGIAVLVAATTGGWLLAPRARAAERIADWAVVVIVLGCWAVIAGAFCVGIAMAGSGFAEEVRDPAYVGSSLIFGVLLALLGIVIFGLFILPFTLAGAAIWAALVHRRLVGTTVGDVATWLAVVLALRPNIVETLFLAVVFVAVPAALDGLVAIGTGGRPIEIARRACPLAGFALAVALILPASPTAFFLAIPWATLTASLGFAAFADRVRRGPRLDALLIRQGALGFAAIGGLLVLDHRIGADPFGFSQFLVLLAAVHFTVAGFVLLTAIEALRHRRGGRAPLLAGGLAIVGGPLTAIGFFGLPGVNIAGALATATAGLIVGLLHIDVARSLPRPAGPLLAVAGGSLLITMPLAATWAIGLLIGTDLLPLDMMTRVHGGLNALGFAIPAAVGWRLVGRSA